MSNVLVISDTHLPFVMEGAIDFLNDVKKEYKCDQVVHIGDYMDNHGMSYHEHDPDGMSTGDESKKVIEMTKDWVKAFPKMKICIGNHDVLAFRKAFTNGISTKWIKQYNEFLGAPDTWEWDYRWEIDNVQYIHGTNFSGKTAAITAAERHRQSTVLGHTHSYAGITFSASERDLIFGMNVGWLGDNRQYAFDYGKLYPAKPVNSCGVVLENGKVPIVLPMDLGSRIVTVKNPVVRVENNQTKFNSPGQRIAITRDALLMRLDELKIPYSSKTNTSKLQRLLQREQAFKRRK